jgi:hypothetical protein
MDEDELRAVLLEAMHNLDTNEADGDEETGRCGGWGRSNRIRAEAQNLNPEELEAAAIWLIDRFGHEAESEEEEEEEEVEAADEEEEVCTTPQLSPAGR